MDIQIALNSSAEDQKSLCRYVNDASQQMSVGKGEDGRAEKPA